METNTENTSLLTTKIICCNTELESLYDEKLFCKECLKIYKVNQKL